MDVRVNEVNSNIRVADARAMLSPEVLIQIVEAVSQHMNNSERQQRQRDIDRSVQRRASPLEH